MKAFEEKVNTLAQMIIERMSDKSNATYYDSFYGIPKNGMIVAQMLSMKIGLPIIYDLKDSKYLHTLIVDDIIDSGKTIAPYINEGFDVATIYNKNKNILPQFTVIHAPQDKWIDIPFEEEQPIEDAVTRIIEFIGEDPNRQGLIDTPNRVRRFYEDWISKDEEIRSPVFTEKYDEMVIVKDIHFYSLCEHHILPFVGVAHIGYVPRGRVIGLSKIVRIVNKYARRLQIQERIGKQIADEMIKLVDAQGVMVVIEAEHLCMSMRGVRSPNHKTITSEIRGVFREPPKGKNPREEFLRLIK